MSSMVKMAAEYRVNSAKFAARIAQLERDGADQGELNSMRNNLKEMRATQRQLLGYYIAPKNPDITLTGAIAKKSRRRDER